MAVFNFKKCFSTGISSRITPCSIWLTSSSFESHFFLLRREFYSDFLLLHTCDDLSWIKCVFWHIFLKENSNCSRSQLVQILSPMSLSEKTRKSNRLQMSLQRQHYQLSYLKDPWAPECWSGPPCFEPVVSRSADRRLSSWANRTAKNDQSWILRNIGPVI